VPLFITFEGGEGSGKSSQSRILSRRLTGLAFSNILIHEPGGTPLGERIRHLLKGSSEFPISAATELLLFNASRSQLVKDVIRPSLEQGKYVICDRFTGSTLAYQSYGRGLDIGLVRELNQFATGGLEPDIVFLLDIPSKLGLSRKNSLTRDRFEKEDLPFHQKVRDGFLKLAAQNPARWVVIDGTLPKNRITGLIWDRVSSSFNQVGNIHEGS
jgi:dTMP kinase